MSNPHTIFIIPYRDRAKEKEKLDIFFQKLQKDRNWNNDEVKFFYIHQLDKRAFNRGAMKNIGFLYVKTTYPNNYKNITLIFHDVDFYPSSTNLLPYTAESGTVQHYYGFEIVLGGIFSIKGSDFEKIGGFPNFWGWGLEDNVIYKRALDNNIQIDRSNFYKIYDDNFIYCDNGDKNEKRKLCSGAEYEIYKNNIESAGTFNSIKKIHINPDDTFINVVSFTTERMYSDNEWNVQNITDGKLRRKKGYFSGRTWNMF